MKDYKKILEGVVNIVNAIENNDIGFDTIRAYISENCPELKESEDERIRKAILNYLTKMWGNSKDDVCGVNVEDAIAWLERQGDYSKLVGEMKKRKELLSKEKENATSDNDKLSLGGRIAMLEELLVFVNEEQGEPVEINPNEFDSRLNKLLKQFESLPKEKLITSLSFYLNVVQNDVTYKEENQREKPQGKSVLEAIKEEKVDNANKIESKDYSSIDPNFFKATDKVEQKFKIGDWVVRGDIITQILDIQDQYYIGIDINGKDFTLSKFLNDDKIHLWTIKDAKEGDVLIDSLGNVCIYQEPSTKLMYHSHCYGNNKYFICMGGSHEIVGSYPATKEQRDKFKKGMDDAGYTFDFEKKKLKKLKFKVGDEVITENEKSLTITKIDEKGYWSNNLFICDFDNECNWNLVEQKPADEVKPKFHKGDWVVDKQGIVHQVANVVENVTNHTYGYDIVGGGYFNDNTEGLRLWTIADAKNGDVLAYVTDEENLWIMIYWSLYKPYEGHVHYHALLVNDNFSDKGTCCICINDLKPATKEQCDLLFQKMKESGYEWNDDKKELKEIEQKPPIVNFKARDWYVNKVDGKIYNAKFMEEPLTNKKRRLEIEKAAMSATGIIEQEEWFIKGAEWSDKNPSYISSEKQDEQKSFDYENANIPQKDSTWSEEDKHWMQKVIDFMKHPDLIKATPTLAKDTINWLKSLKDRVQPQSKQEWSEDDSARLQRVINFLIHNRKGDTDTIYQQEQDIDWLKAIKDRYAWLPSNEQMKVCKEVYADLLSAKGFDVGTINSELNRLEEKLK